MHLIYNNTLKRNGVKCSKSQNNMASTFWANVWCENYDIDYIYSEKNNIKRKIF